MSRADRCPVYGQLPRLITLVRLVRSDSIEPYVEEVRRVICETCPMGGADHCERREHLDCALDLYLPLIVQTIEECLRIGEKTPAQRGRN
jgi:hypothetical protein